MLHHCSAKLKSLAVELPAAQRPGPSFGGPADHGQGTDVDRLGEQPVQLREQRLQVGHGQMGIQGGAIGPVFVEDKD